MSVGRRSGRPRRGGEAAPEDDAPKSSASSGARARGGKALSEEDIALWRRVVGSVKRADRTPESDVAGSRPKAATPSEPAPASTTPPRQETRVVRPEARTAPSAAAPVPRRTVGALSPSTPGLDRRTAERLRRGKIAPDARIDLHGMTAARAHQALIGFVQRSHASGLRCVLVITGKGGRPRAPEAGRWREPEPGEGVLKSHAPQWLASPPIGGLVVGVYPAHVSHGGGGAFYVYLRKNSAAR